MERSLRVSDRIILSSIIILTKSLSLVIRLFGLGKGLTWPGELALSLKRKFVQIILSKNSNLKTILIVGTNGKTTCAKLLMHILKTQKINAISNNSGANLLNGIASTLIRNANMFGAIKAEAAVFEVDENTLPLFINQFAPTAIVALNLFRDQLDRYGEVDITRAKLEYSFLATRGKTRLILNGQDPNLFFLFEKRKRNVHFFGLKDCTLPKKRIPSMEADATYCPSCLTTLIFSRIAYSHIGIFRCKNCGSNENVCEDLAWRINSPLKGNFNQYNLSAVTLLVKKLFNIKPETVNQSLKGFTPAFGRQETMTYKGKKIIVQLSKNPVSFNQSISLIEKTRNKKNVLIVLNDNIPDGQDVSWIWDVNFEKLVKIADQIWVSGNRAYDMGIRLKYAAREALNSKESESILQERIFISKNMDETLERALKSCSKGETIHAFPVYSGMLQLRQKLVGNSISV